jgi:glyoxylase-like metal-dependent hydrolase (beta-lactamase superfamily II)
VALFERSRGWLFGGDAFVGGEDRAARPKPDIRQVIASLGRLRALEPRILFAGSGRVYQDAAATLGRKIAYLEDLGGRVLALHERGVVEEEIARRLLGRDGWFSLFTSGDYRAIHLVRSYLRSRQDPLPPPA